MGLGNWISRTFEGAVDGTIYGSPIGLIGSGLVLTAKSVVIAGVAVTPVGAMVAGVGAAAAIGGAIGLTQAVSQDVYVAKHSNRAVEEAKSDSKKSAGTVSVLNAFAPFGLGSVVTVNPAIEAEIDARIRAVEAKSKSQKSKSQSSKQSSSGSSSTSHSNSSSSRKLILPHERGEFEFDPNKDEDYTGGNPTCKLQASSAIKQLVKAFKRARQRLEEEFRRIDFRARPADRPYINVSDWRVTSVDTIVVLDDDGELQRMAFPVELTANVRIEVSLGVFVTYEAHIDLDNPIRDYQGNGPHGPHVGWDYDRVGSDGPRGRTGHILLNVNMHLPDRHRGMEYDDFVEAMEDYDEPIEVIDPKMLFDGSLDDADFLLVRINIYDDTYDEDLQQRVNLAVIEMLFDDEMDKFPESDFFRKYRR